MADLVATLQGSSDWYTIGLKLNVPTSELDNIKSDYKSYKEQKQEMFRAWLATLIENGIKPTWRLYQDVLKEVKMSRPLQIVNQRYSRYFVTFRLLYNIYVQCRYFPDTFQCDP